MLLDAIQLQALLAPLPLPIRERLIETAVQDLRTLAASARDAPTAAARNAVLHQLRGAAGGIGATALLDAIAAGVGDTDLVKLADATAAELLRAQ